MGRKGKGRKEGGWEGTEKRSGKYKKKETFYYREHIRERKISYVNLIGFRSEIDLERENRSRKSIEKIDGNTGRRGKEEKSVSGRGVLSFFLIFFFSPLPRFE